MVKNHSDSRRGNSLPPHGLLFPISSKCSFICIIPRTGYHIPQPLLHQSWSTGWNEKQLNGFTMKDRSDDPSHHERTLLPRSYISLPVGRCEALSSFSLDALNTVYSWLYGITGHMVNNHMYFSFHPVLHNWCNKGHGMCYPVWDGVYKRSLGAKRKKWPMWRQRVSSLAI